jgi:hypothetical protein
MKRWWVRFYTPESMMPTFEYPGPWWVSGSCTRENVEHLIVCVATRAETEEAAKANILGSFDEGNEEIVWSFCEERGGDWSPFSGRFTRAAWMEWPAESERQ